jgi:hypothetical protein
MRLTVRRVVEAVALFPNRDDLFRNYPELEPDADHAGWAASVLRVAIAGITIQMDADDFIEAPR